MINVFDIREPIGFLFLGLGALIAGYGYTAGAQELVTVGVPLNLNIIWGLVMFVFGMVMVCLAKLQQALEAEAQMLEEARLKDETQL
jgi:hypothetical protein